MYNWNSNGCTESLLPLVAALTVVQVVVVTVFFLTRARDAERANRRAVSMKNTHLQETLIGVKAIRSFASEAAFRAALRASVSSQDRAVLTVAHRLSTAREADRVLVMEEGQIVEEGPPEELVLQHLLMVEYY